MRRYALDSSGSRREEMTGGEHGHKPSSSIEDGELIHKLSVLSDYHEGLCSMKSIKVIFGIWRMLGLNTGQVC
jgi:hypothetical protein